MRQNKYLLLTLKECIICTMIRMKEIFMNNWELAKYLLSAKKDIDSLLYIKENLDNI